MTTKFHPFRSIILEVSFYLYISIYTRKLHYIFLVDEMGILNHKYRDEKYARRLLIAGLVNINIQ